MDNNFAIKVENVSKKFSKSLKSSMDYGLRDIWCTALGLRTYSERLRKNEFWAVNNVSFQVKRGEALGIIGPNGSGKTTFLKMLNGIFLPDKGKITIRGNTGALIAVGAGFHPMFTGRENIYINGAIMGMGRREIDKKFDSIVKFSGISDFIDTPVKYYSSGMFVRLGFAIAAHCDPDILLIDEVLAVGDMAFQAKCLNKINEFAEEGKTIIFISHQMEQVEALCDRVILLMNGQIAHEGKTSDTIDFYKSKTISSLNNTNERQGTGEVIVTAIELLDKDGNISYEFDMGDPVTFRIHYEAKKRIANQIFSVGIFSQGNMVVSHMMTETDGIAVGAIEGRGYVDLHVHRLTLLPNSYVFNATIIKEGGLAPYDEFYSSLHFSIRGGRRLYGVCQLEHSWDLESGRHNPEYLRLRS